MDKWIWENSNGIKFLNLPHWDKMGVDIIFTSRHGGYSHGDFASLNMALHVGDDEDVVIQNRSKVLDIIGMNLDNIVCAEQVHGDNIAIVNVDSLGKGAYRYSSAIEKTDALVTNLSQVCLTTFYADCFPIYLFDPVGRVIGLAHSGWKGTMMEIGKKTVELMVREYACNINDIEVFIGPGIHKCCFQIDNSLAQKVEAKFTGQKNILFRQEKGFLWDLPKTNCQGLIKMGIKEENISVCNLCTSCNTKDFFSYRKEEGKTGRMAAMISLRY